MRFLIFLVYLAVIVALIYAQPGTFVPGLVLGVPGAFFAGRGRAEWGRMLDDVRRDYHRRNHYRARNGSNGG